MKCKTDKPGRHKDGSGHHHPMRIFPIEEQMQHLAIAPSLVIFPSPSLLMLQGPPWAVQNHFLKFLSVDHVCFEAVNGLKSDIAPCPKSAKRRHRMLGLE
jgi:hypothetical protein